MSAYILVYIDHIRTNFTPLKVSNTLFEEANASARMEFSSLEYRLNSVVVNVAMHHRLQPRLTDDDPSESQRQLLKFMSAIFVVME